ncbi:hypothetical protein [Phaeovulum sp.]|uniref:hypothetical protein n=1 Tax=Phaeovulum sp. TaxID=2934796 RepID=UPI0039E2AE88
MAKADAVDEAGIATNGSAASDHGRNVILSRQMERPTATVPDLQPCDVRRMGAANGNFARGTDGQIARFTGITA